jgi:serine/threonine protein kinase
MMKLGKFEILGKIGQGAMGVVYKARDPLIGRIVALKTITTGLAESPDLLNRFYREAQSAGRLQHPNIVTIFELGSEGSTPFIAMEFLTGESLEKLIARRPKMPLSQKLGYIVRVCQALEYAHRQNPSVVHRDIKPANVMVTSDETVKVVDFGIAHLGEVSHSESSGMLLGTLKYMSPQLFRGGTADARSDIWSTGIMLYELLCYHPPFDAENPGALVTSIMVDQHRSISEAAPGTPAEIEAIVDRMLCKELDGRYQNMDEVLMELEPVWHQMQKVEVSSLVADGRQLFEARDLAKAEDIVRKALQIDASNTQAKSLLEKINAELRRSTIIRRVIERVENGQNFLSAGQIEEAKAEAEAALRLDSTFQPAKELLEQMQAAAERVCLLANALRASKQRLAEGALTEAELQLDKALEIDPENSAAQDLLQQIRDEKARRDQDAQKALKEFPQNAELLILSESAKKGQEDKERENLRRQRIQEIEKRIERQELTSAIDLARQTLVTVGQDPRIADTLLKAERELEFREQKKRQPNDIFLKARNLLEAGKLTEATHILQDAIDIQLLPAGDPRLVQLFNEIDARKHSPPATFVEPRPTLIASADSLGTGSQSSSFKLSPPSFGTLPPDATMLIRGPDPLFPRVHLVFTNSTDTFLVGRSVTIDKIPFLIGRAAPHLSIPSDAALSREHCVIDWDGSVFTLADLESTNGTFLNGRRVLPDRKEPLLFGATIRLSSSTVLTFASDDLSELPDFTGQVIDKRFRLVRLIRASVKAAVYEASDSRLPRPVAIKLLSPSLAAYPGYLEQFNREAQTAAALHHPHVCKIVDHGQSPLDLGNGKTSQVNYLCMEMLDGGSLADKLAAKSYIDCEQACAWLDPLSDALNYMHLQGVIHSGLKPTSVVFDKNGSPYITDFAIANSPRESGRQAMLGAPDFLAPEQWDGLAPTQASDQYALAVLTYLMITGSRPYEAQHDPDNRRKNYARGHVPAHEQALHCGAGELPRAISDVLKRALSLRPEERYASVRDFFLAFRRSVSSPGSRRAGMPRVFISYRRDLSAGWAVLFARELSEKHKISAFVDTQRVDTAVRLPVKLLNAIQDCDIFVCLLGKNTLRSAWVQEEIRLAWQNNKPMVPVFQEGFGLPSETATSQPQIAALLSYEGVHLLDRRNIHIDHTVSDLAKIINSSIATEKGSGATGER